MSTYKVTVNGNVYEVVVEKADGAAIANNVKVAAPKAPVSGNGTTVNAPMPGNVLNVNVTEGQSVKSGEVLLILEAMKMENEIMAPCDGVVSNLVTKGSSVDTGAVLCVIS